MRSEALKRKGRLGLLRFGWVLEGQAVEQFAHVKLGPGPMSEAWLPLRNWNRGR